MKLARLVFITGAASGLGQALAWRYHQAGAELALVGRHESTIKSWAEQRGISPDRYKIYSADVAIAASIVAAGEACLRQQGVPDVVVNNAGLFIQGTISDEPADNLQKLMEINLYSAYHLTRALLPAMKAQGRGHIFNMCSIASLRAYPHGSSYGITKYAMAGFNANLREEMKPFGIKVTGVFPGATMSDSWAGSGVQPERIMQANDVAKMIVSAAQLSPAAVVEDIVMRPQLGDL